MTDITFLALTAVLLTVTASSVAVLAWVRSTRPFRYAFALIMVAEVIIVWSYLLDVSSATLEDKLLWNTMEYVGYLFAGPLFFTFAAQYVRANIMTRRLQVLLFAPAFVFLAALITNEYHHLFYVSTTLSPDEYRSFNAVYGPLFILYVIYALSMLFVGNALLLHHYRRTSGTHKRANGVVCLATTTSFLVILINYLLIYSLPGSLFVVLGLLVTGLLFFAGAFGFELFKVVPFALDTVMETMQDGVLILDDCNHLIYVNHALENIVRRSSSSVYLLGLDEVLPSFPASLLNDETLLGADVHELLPGRFFDINVAMIRDQSGYVTGKVITVRELTAQKLAEKDARDTRAKLSLLESITRHDILNQLTVIEGHLSLVQTRSTEGPLRAHLAASMLAARNIEKQIAFTKDYQDMGAKAKVWQDVDHLFQAAWSNLDRKEAKLDIGVDGLEVYADPLLSKVFYNLLDNSLSHGERVTMITVSMVEKSDALQLIYSDDGTGISVEAKKKLFQRGFGKNTGLGLFLSREILIASGLSIEEDGKPGNGARFVITVPQGLYRFSTKPPGQEMGNDIGRVEQEKRASSV